MKMIDEKAKRDADDARDLALSKEADLKKLLATRSTPAKKRHAEAEEKTKVKWVLTPNQKKASSGDLITDYKKNFGRDPDENGALVFASRDEAIQFFDDQAQLGREFFCSEIRNGKETGFHVFSCGSGQLYKGTLLEIRDQLTEAFSKDSGNEKLAAGLNEINGYVTKADSPAPNPASDMRAKIKDERPVEEDTALEKHSPVKSR